MDSMGLEVDICLILCLGELLADFVFYTFKVDTNSYILLFLLPSASHRTGQSGSEGVATLHFLVL